MRVFQAFLFEKGLFICAVPYIVLFNTLLLMMPFKAIDTLLIFSTYHFAEVISLNTTTAATITSTSQSKWINA